MRRDRARCKQDPVSTRREVRLRAPHSLVTALEADSSLRDQRERIYRRPAIEETLVEHQEADSGRDPYPTRHRQAVCII